MKKLFKLTKINLLTLYDIHKFINAKSFEEKKKYFPMLFLLLYIFGITGYFVFSGTSFVLKGLMYLNMPYLLLVVAMVTTSIYLTFTSIFKVNKILFSAKDYTFLLSLPIKKSIIISSKVLILYINNLVFALLFMLPTYFAYITKIHTSFVFHIFYFITLFLIPIIPTIIGSIIGSLLTSLASRFKYKNILSIIFTLGFVLVIYYFSFKAQSLSTIDLANLSNYIINKFNGIYPLTKVYLEIVKNNSILNLLLFSGITFGLFYIFVSILVRFFDNINSRLASVTIRNKYDSTKINISSETVTLYKKEIKKYFSSSLYVLNTAISCIMLIVVLSVLAIFGSQSLDALFDIPDFTSYFVLGGPVIFSVICAMSCTTNSSISLEGKNLWIIKSLPININKLFIAKILVNLTILLPTIFIGTFILAFIAKISLFDFLLMLFVPSVYALFISGFGLLINLYFPDFDWVNEIKVIKQSIAVLVSMATGMILALIPVFIKININKSLYSLLIGLVMCIITFILYSILFSKGKNIFKSL